MALDWVPCADVSLLAAAEVGSNSSCGAGGGAAVVGGGAGGAGCWTVRSDAVAVGVTTVGAGVCATYTRFGWDWGLCRGCDLGLRCWCDGEGRPPSAANGSAPCCTQ